jgi:hypothetical protein
MKLQRFLVGESRSRATGRRGHEYSFTPPAYDRQADVSDWPCRAQWRRACSGEVGTGSPIRTCANRQASRLWVDTRAGMKLNGTKW